MMSLLVKLLQNKKNVFIIFVFILILFFSYIIAEKVSAAWGTMDAMEDGYEIINNNSRNDIKIKVQLYNDKPKIVWQSDTGAVDIWGDIYYAQWSGTQWTKADGTAGYDNLTVSTGNHDEAYIELDSSGNPKIIFRNKNSEKINYTQWSPSACGGSGCWTKADGTTSSPSYDAIGYYDPVLDFDLDSSNNPHIIWRYYDSGYFDVYYTQWSGTAWTYADGVTGGNEKIDLNGGAIVCHIGIYNNMPIIITDDQAGGNSEIQYTQWSGSDWTNADGLTGGWENISNTATHSNRPRFKIDNNGNIKVTWYEETAADDEIYYTQWTVNQSDWTNADGVNSGGENVSDNAGDSSLFGIMLDNSGNPVLIWLDDSGGNSDICYSQYTPGIGWTKADGSTLGYDNVSNSAGYKNFALMAYDSTNHPNIVWNDDIEGNYDVYFSQYVPSVGWTKADKTTLGKENISNNSGVSNPQSIILNSVNEPYVFWYDNTDGDYDVYFSRWMQTQFGDVNITANVEPSLTVNLSSAICDYGTFSATTIKTCNYYTEVDTNASGGYVAYLKEDGDLRNATNSIANVADDEVTATYEEYGVATSDSDYLSLDINQQVIDCASLDGGSAAAAVALTTSDQSCAIASEPVSNDTVYICLSAAVSGATPAGAYSNIVTLTIVGNF